MSVQVASASNWDSRTLDASLRRISSLGANVIVGWRFLPAGIKVAYIPSYDLPSMAKAFPNLLRFSRKVETDTDFGAMVTRGCGEEIITILGAFDHGSETERMINDAIRHFSVTQSDCRAVALFDIVSFSIHSPFEQITQVSVLSHYIRLAARRCESLGMPIDLCMSTTGDGFYVWNANEGLDADVALFCTAMLALAYSTSARDLAETQSVPRLRCSLHFGSHYEYFQTASSSSNAGCFIIGDVTIDLARLLSKAKQDQLLIGAYTRELGDTEAELKKKYGITRIETPAFMAYAQQQFAKFSGLPIPGGKIADVKAYLTGPQATANLFSIKKYYVGDKHGIEHPCYNGKFNVTVSNGTGVYFGLQQRELDDFDARSDDAEDIQIRVI